MKKLILSVAVVAAAAFVACTSSKTSDSAAAITSKIENCTNTDSLKTYVNQAKAPLTLPIWTKPRSL